MMTVEDQNIMGMIMSRDAAIRDAAKETLDQQPVDQNRMSKLEAHIKELEAQVAAERDYDHSDMALTKQIMSDCGVSENATQLEERVATRISKHCDFIRKASHHVGLKEGQPQPADELLDALQLALNSHGVFLMSDPPQDAWKRNSVESKARQAIANYKAAKPRKMAMLTEEEILFEAHKNFACEDFFIGANWAQRAFAEKNGAIL